jgi:hypothetical protein
VARLVIRADATPEVGAGHLMRCASLGEAWTTGGLGPVRVQGRVTLPFVVQRLREIGIERCPEDGAMEAADVLLIDSYSASVRAEGAQARAGLKVLVDDVGGAVPDGFDVVWNPNAYGSALLYPGFSGRVLTGASCVPLRAGLPRWSGASGEGTAVALGGSSLPAPLRMGLEAALDGAAWRPVVGVGTWLPAGWRSVPADEPWGSLSGCRRAVVGAGTSTWEAAAIGIPAVVVCFAPNQRLVFEWAAAAGVAVADLSGGDAAEVAHRLRGVLADARALPAIGNGATLVASVLRSLAADRVVS